MAIAATVMLVSGAAACEGGTPPSSARDLDWRQDIAYLKRELPARRVDGLGQLPAAAWNSAAARLEAQVPRLTDGQIIVGMARMVAMLDDDETLVQVPPGPFYSLDAEWFGPAVILIGVPAADRDLLGGQLVAVDGHPIGAVMAEIGSVIGNNDDPVLLAAGEAGYLDDAALLNWLGITTSQNSETLTVRRRAGGEVTRRIVAAGRADIGVAGNDLFEILPGMAHPPVPLYLENITTPYWLRVLPAQRAVFLKYNACLSTSGFQQLAVRAIAVLKDHPGYRLIIDLRDNLGGSTGPFQALITAITSDPALNRTGKIFGLVNQFTDSAATDDAQLLEQGTHAVLIGSLPMQPRYGNWLTFPLPHSGIVVQYTTTLVNGTGAAYGRPDLTVTPTLAQAMTGTDPVLTAALGWVGS